MTKITRRQMLKLIAASTLWAKFAPKLHARAQYPTVPNNNFWSLQGRAIHTVAFYEEASTQSERLATRTRDQSFRILGETHAPFSAHNDLWYETELGYAHSAWILPIKVYPPQDFIADIGEWGMWGQVSQIYTEAYTQPALNAGRKYRFYGSTVYHVIETHLDDDNVGWYKVVDDYPPRSHSYQWVLARDLRRIPKAELAPIRPFSGNKHIEVDLSTQTLVCYEGEKAVFNTKTASGVGGELATPIGEHCVLLKQASRHMSNVPYADLPEEEQPAPGDIFDLPGVPWNIFFDLSGTAIHGAYWHNDFGIRRSHGCINVSCAAARFIYRWTHPLGGYEDAFVQSNCQVGTKIVIT